MATTPGKNDLQDYPETDDKMENHCKYTTEEANWMLESDNDNEMDLLDPTGTPAIAQGGVVFYNDLNIMDPPIEAANLPPAIPAVIASKNPTNTETSSQNELN